MKLTLSTGEAYVGFAYAQDKKRRRTVTFYVNDVTTGSRLIDATSVCSTKDRFVRAYGRLHAYALGMKAARENLTKADRQNIGNWYMKNIKNIVKN